MKIVKQRLSNVANSTMVPYPALEIPNPSTLPEDPSPDPELEPLFTPEPEPSSSPEPEPIKQPDQIPEEKPDVP